jgi:hypothetical protein
MKWPRNSRAAMDPEVGGWKPHEKGDVNTHLVETTLETWGNAG